MGSLPTLLRDAARGDAPLLHTLPATPAHRHRSCRRRALPPRLHYQHARQPTARLPARIYLVCVGTALLCRPTSGHISYFLDATEIKLWMATIRFISTLLEHPIKTIEEEALIKKPLYKLKVLLYNNKNLHST